MTQTAAGLCFEMGFMQGLKPDHFEAVTARLKSCPDTKPWATRAKALNLYTGAFTRV
jgi:hypothetical protein